jgi:DNA ligase (NAD+)
LITDLDSLGVNVFRLPAEAPPADTDLPLAGMSFVLTGTLPELSRSEATDLIRRSGGSVTGSVSKSTDYLVAGASPGSKMQKAEKLGVPIIDEPGLRNLLRSH